jgi:hypothetical protein
MLNKSIYQPTSDKPKLEYHIHIDIFDDSYNIHESISHLQGDLNFIIKDHTFNHYLRDDVVLNTFHGSEPQQHYSIEHNLTNPKDVETLSSAIFLAIQQNPQKFKGYMEYESVFWNDFSKFELEDIFPVLPKDLFEEITGAKEIIIEESQKYIEFHWTIPVEMLRQNIDLFKQSKMRGVSIIKNGIQCVVLTTLFPTMNSAKSMYSKIAKIGYGSIKREFKQYLSDLPITMRQVKVKE